MKDDIFLVFGILAIVFFGLKTRTFLKEIWRNHDLLIGLSVNDLKTKYAGSYLGVLWAFVQPILTTFIYWFIFQIGFRLAPVDDFPFILWLITGLVPWFLFSDAVMSATASMQEYSYLVKKVMFHVDILPAVKVISSLIIHIVFVLFVLLCYLGNGIALNLYLIQVVYYSFCLVVLAIGIVYITATLNVFIKDTMQVVSVIMQLLFWMTPIVWDLNIMPPFIQNLLQLNPLCYIVMGYRDSFINHIWFWDKLELTIIFWVITSGVLFIGICLFKKLKNHFADVL